MLNKLTKWKHSRTMVTLRFSFLSFVDEVYIPNNFAHVSWVLRVIMLFAGAAKVERVKQGSH